MPPPHVNTGDPIRAALINEILDELMGRVVGDGDIIQVHRSGDQLVIRFGRRIPGSQRPGFWMRIDDAQKDENNKTQYGYSQVELSNEEDAWTGVSGGHSGTVNDGTYAVNGMDAPNTSSGTQGNNIDTNNLNAGITLQTLAIGAVVRGNWARLKDGSSEDPNGGWRAVVDNTYLVDGTCV